MFCIPCRSSGRIVCAQFSTVAKGQGYHANALGKAGSLIVPHEEYLRLGRDAAERQDAYRALFKAHLDGEVIGQIRGATNGNYALGSERFQREIEAALGRRASRGQSGRPRKDEQKGANQVRLL